MGHTPGWAIFVIVIVIIPTLAFICYAGFIQYRARRRGLPAPSLNPFSDANRISGHQSGLRDWYNMAIDKVRNRSGATGAYESTNTRSRSQRQAFAALDPDEAWDARVGNEADGYGPGGYYEEQELGLHSTSNAAYDGSAYRQTSRQSLDGLAGTRGTDYEAERGRSREAATKHDPFGDTAERSDLSLRGVSPRPHDEDDQATNTDQRRN